MLPLKDCIEDELALHVEVYLVIRWILQVQVKEDDSDQQRKNIFHIRCYVQNKVCSLIIDSGSYTNMSSTTLLVNWICVLLSILDFIDCNGRMIMVKWKWLNKLWFCFQLGNILMNFCVMW
jgi:hypothetical protein